MFENNIRIKTNYKSNYGSATHYPHPARQTPRLHTSVKLVPNASDHALVWSQSGGHWLLAAVGGIMLSRRRARDDWSINDEDDDESAVTSLLRPS